MRLTLPLPPNIANSRMHWRTRNRKRNDYEDRCTIVAGWSKDPPMNKARITVKLYTWSTMDTDNLMARLKWPVDWLVKAGYLVDDDPTHLEWIMPTQKIDRKNRRVVINLDAL